MTGLVLLVGVLWVFGGLQRGVLAQDGGKFSYPRALDRLESLVATIPHKHLIISRWLACVVLSLPKHREVR